MKGVFRFCLLILASSIFLPLFVVVAVAVRFVTRSCITKQAKPRLVWGPTPILSIRYMANAMTVAGYEATTLVRDIYAINARQDFDYTFADFQPRLSLLSWLRPFCVFLWVLPRFDVYHFFFDGGFLAGTPLRFLECQLLHLAGKKIIAMPYGSDVAVPTLIHSLPWRQGLMAMYSSLGTQELRIRFQIQYFSKHADFIIGCILHMETLPKWDLLTTHYYPIDTDAWGPSSSTGRYDGKNGSVCVVHAPNHRGLKGTDFLIKACRELEEEGYRIRLRLLERVSNAEVKQAMSDCDIVAEQFIHGYALTAMEGMSLEKPVLSNLSDDHYYQVLRLYTGLDECPIVNTTVAGLKDKLRMLVSDPKMRKDLGEAGRRYVLKYHSYDSVGRMWDVIYRIVWYDEGLDVKAWHPDRVAHWFHVSSGNSSG